MDESSTAEWIWYSDVVKGEPSPTGRGRRSRDEKGNQEVGDIRFTNILQLFSIYFFFSITLLYHFFLYFFYPRHLPTPTHTTHTLDPRPTTFSYTQHTVCAGESRALQTNWSNSLCNDVAGSRDLFSRYQCGFCHQGRKYPTQSAITFLTDSIRRHMDVRVRFSGKSKSGFPNPNTDFEFFWANPKTDHESIKSTLRVDSSDQIQIQIFEIHNLSVFLGKDSKKVFLTSGFSKK